MDIYLSGSYRNYINTRPIHFTRLRALAERVLRQSWTATGAPFVSPY